MHWKDNLSNASRFMLGKLDVNSSITFHFKHVIKLLLQFEGYPAKYFLVSNMAGM